MSSPSRSEISSANGANVKPLLRFREAGGFSFRFGAIALPSGRVGKAEAAGVSVQRKILEESPRTSRADPATNERTSRSTREDETMSMESEALSRSIMETLHWVACTVEAPGDCFSGGNVFKHRPRPFTRRLLQSPRKPASRLKAAANAMSTCARARRFSRFWAAGRWEGSLRSP